MLLKRRLHGVCVDTGLKRGLFSCMESSWMLFQRVMYDGRETPCSVLYALSFTRYVYSFFFFCIKAHYFVLVLFSMRTVYISCTYACKCRQTEKHCIECTFKEFKPNTTVLTSFYFFFGIPRTHISHIGYFFLTFVIHKNTVVVKNTSTLKVLFGA